MNIRLILLSVAFVWMLQLMLSLLQTRRFHREVAALRGSGGITSVGMSGRNWTLKNYGVLVVDDERRIRSAHRLTGITVFAGLREVPELAGMSLSVLSAAEPIAGISGKLWAAFRNASEFILGHDHRAANSAEASEAVESYPSSTGKNETIEEA